MRRASDKRELLRVAERFRRPGPFTPHWADLHVADKTAFDVADYYVGAIDRDYKGQAAIFESLAYEEPPRNGYVDDVPAFVLPEWPRTPEEIRLFNSTAPGRGYARGFRDGVASLNTERAEARAQLEVAEARIRALIAKKGRR